jgi:peptidoglycan/xylan/chitin deacetylase (PgdA/CDA1 family)
MVTTYSDIRRHQDRGLRLRARRFLRSRALDLASAFTSDEALQRPRVQIVFLHHVMADEERPFRALLERLLRRHAFVPYSEAVARVAAGDVDRPTISVTFDDGLRSQLRAAEILGDYGIPACFFVCEAMADAPSSEEIREFCERELWLPPVDFLSWSDLERLKAAGHEIGNHTRRHRSLAALSGQELADEIGGSLASLRRRLGNDVRHFAWPRGWFHDFSAAAAAEVFRAGHVSCASGVRGCHIPGPPRALRDVCLRRDQVIAADPLRHTIYFLARNSLHATDATRDWPEW